MIKIYDDLIQGSDEWLQARLGLLCASEVRLMLTYVPPQDVQLYTVGEPKSDKPTKARQQVFDWDGPDYPLTVSEIADGAQVSDALVRSMIKDGEVTAVQVRLPGRAAPIDNDKTRAHVYELAAQRISQYVEPHYISDDMIRGHQDEALAVYLYSEKIAPVTQVGFITRSFGDFTIGYSPDGLVGSDGLLEVKSRRQKYQVQTIAELLPANQIAPEYVMQAQTGLLVTGRKWLDHISYSGGLPMAVVRVFPDPLIQDAILSAATQFEAKVSAVMAAFEANSRGLLPTERVIEQDIFV